jgi:hypothetical protein
VCTPFLGPNYNNPFGGKVSPYNFLISCMSVSIVFIFVVFFFFFLRIFSLYYFLTFCIGSAPNISDDLFNYSDYRTWTAANPINFTSSDGNCATANETLFTASLSICASLTINSPLAVQCAALVPTAPINFVYQACLDDVICTGDYSFGPSSIDAYSKICSADVGPGITQYTHILSSLPQFLLSFIFISFVFV